jgi:hypothetical protein
MREQCNPVLPGNDLEGLISAESIAIG